MSKWSEVGHWIQKNAGSGAVLVGSLITGNVPAAVAAGVALVSSATGTTDPVKALASLQTDPKVLVELQRLANEEQASIRAHIQAMHQAELEDAQLEQHETQETIRAGDKAEDRLVRWTRPLQSWFSLIAAVTFVFNTVAPDATTLGLLLALPWAYAGLRQIGKGIDSFVSTKINK